MRKYKKFRVQITYRETYRVDAESENDAKQMVYMLRSIDRLSDKTERLSLTARELYKRRKNEDNKIKR